MAHHMRHPPTPNEVTQIRLSSAGFPYACNAGGDPVRAGVLEEGHPDDDLPFGDDMTPEEEELLADAE